MLTSKDPLFAIFWPAAVNISVVDNGLGGKARIYHNGVRFVIQAAPTTLSIVIESIHTKLRP